MDMVQLIAGAHNFEFFIMSLFVIPFMVAVYNKTTDPIVKDFTQGIFLVAIAAALHRGYWMLADLTSGPDQHIADWGNDNRWLLFIIVQIAVAGYALHTKTALVHLFGKDKWWWLPAGLATTSAFFGYLIALF